MGYVYNKLGNITKIWESGTCVAQYTYDAQNQLTKEILLQVQSDLFDNDYTYGWAIKSIFRHKQPVF